MLQLAAALTYSTQYTQHTQNQMAGRAGRRGYDTLGNCVLLPTRFDGAETGAGIIGAGPEPLSSQFSTSYGMVLNLLSCYSLDQAREFLSKSFGQYMSGAGNARRLREVGLMVCLCVCAHCCVCARCCVLGGVDGLLQPGPGSRLPAQQCWALHGGGSGQRVLSLAILLLPLCQLTSPVYTPTLHNHRSKSWRRRRCDASP